MHTIELSLFTNAQPR